MWQEGKAPGSPPPKWPGFTPHPLGVTAMQGCLVVCSCRSAALTCLVLLPIPRVPVPNQVTRVIGIRMQLGQHLLPAGGTGSGLWGAPGLPQMGEKGQVELASSSCASLSKKSAEFLTPECSRHPHLPSQPSTRDSKILLTPQLAPPQPLLGQWAVPQLTSGCCRHPDILASRCELRGKEGNTQCHNRERDERLCYQAARAWEGCAPPASGATHTGSCRGCWSLSWTEDWSGHPCGDPPCAQTGSGTSCPQHPVSTPCRTAPSAGQGGRVGGHNWAQWLRSDVRGKGEAEEGSCSIPNPAPGLRAPRPSAPHGEVSFISGNVGWPCPGMWGDTDDTEAVHSVRPLPTERQGLVMY